MSKSNGHAIAKRPTRNGHNGVVHIAKSLAEVEADFRRQHQAYRTELMTNRATQFEKALQLTRNFNTTDVSRQNLLKFLLDGPRDIDSECGYPPYLTPEHYRAMYDREGIAKRVVDCEPEETWAMDPEVYEDEDPQNETDFEYMWSAFNKSMHAWHFLQRADVLSGIGQYGIILIGLDDGLDMAEPVEGIEDDGSGQATENTVLFLRVFSEEVLFVAAREIDTSNPRFGLPKMYQIQFRDYSGWGTTVGENISRNVHWSRVVHVADNRKMSEVFGVPRMQPVYNRLYDLRKVYSSAGEAFWKGAFPGMAFEVNPELADQGVVMDKEAMREEMRKYMDGSQRYIAITGVTAKTLPPQLVDPTGTVEALLKAIAISKGIPYRVLFGSEEAKLAGSQDTRAWNKRMSRRQERYVTPMVVRPFVDRLIQFGVLPEPAEYHVDWPDLNAPTDQDQATVALTRTQALSAYASSGLDGLIPPKMYFTLILGMTEEEAQETLDAGEEYAAEFEAKAEEEHQRAVEQAQASVGPGDPNDPNAGEGPPKGLANLSSKKRAEGKVEKPPFVENEYDPGQERDEQGRWTDMGGGSPGSAPSPNAMTDTDKWMSYYRKNIGFVTDRQEHEFEGALDRFLLKNPDMSDDEIENTIEAVQGYGTSEYKNINNSLRIGEINGDMDATVERIKRFMSVQPAYTGEVYRGVTLSSADTELFKKGQVLSDRGFLSTSRDPAVVEDFLGIDDPERNVRATFVLQDTKGLGRKMVGYTGRDEKEILYPPKTKIKITKVETAKGLGRMTVFGVIL